MDLANLTESVKSRLRQAIDRFAEDLNGLRTGRASASMLDGVMVEAYGSNMPLNQVASIAVPEAQLIQITPYDPSNLAAISAAIRANQSLGLNPADDGRVVRVPIPPLTEDRRKELAKQVSQKQEDTMISLRNIRHEALGVIDKAKKAKQIGEDEAKRLSHSVEESITKAREQIDSQSKLKEQEILKL